MGKLSIKNLCKILKNNNKEHLMLKGRFGPMALETLIVELSRS
jgi:hypothetical protein